MIVQECFELLRHHIILLFDGEFTALYTIINNYVDLPLTKKLRQKEKLISL